jgi:hypothetical protein
MIHDGVRCRRSRVYGWRAGNPETDVDDHGDPVKSNYIVLVRIKDCPVEDKDGRRYYEPKGVPQAVVLGYGGTYYGYGKVKVVRDGQGRYVNCRNEANEIVQEFRCSYVKIPYYVVRDGHVYVGACYRGIEPRDKK